MNVSFERVRRVISDSFDRISWITDGCMTEDALRKSVAEIERATPKKALAKAKTFALIAEGSAVAIDKEDIFQDKLCGYGILLDQRLRWANAVKASHLAEESAAAQDAWETLGTYLAVADFGHTSPNTRLLLTLGFSGLYARVEAASFREGLTQKQKDFYLSCKIVLQAMMTAARRLGQAIMPYNKENAEALLHIAEGAPTNIYEAMQLLILYFFMHEYVGGARVRTLGRLDALLSPFYRADIEKGVYTHEEIREMLKFFLYKFWCAQVPFDLPFCLGGVDESGVDVTNEMSYLIVEVYDGLCIHSPKIHIRVSDSTPRDFVMRVLDCIRRGNSSFVFVNDAVAIESLTRVGIESRDACDYVPIGCYEPAVWGTELGCTGNGGVNLPKAVELLFCDGCDAKSGKRCGLALPAPASFDEFLTAVKKQITHMTEAAMDYIRKIEPYYGEINPDPLLSCQYENSVNTGVDLYDGGAKYNNSSLIFFSIASLVDACLAVKHFVYEEKIFTFEAFGKLLKADWQGYERERLMARRLPSKYGNGDTVADALTAELSAFCASLVNGKPNARGGVFKASLFSIDYCFHNGERTMATPDGRHAGDPLSKNLCATVGMDRRGITALIRSVTAIDHASFPNGSVLDVVLHPSAVSGEDGICAFYGLLMTYFKRGGFAMHGNVFDAATLKEAQRDPERYKNLQVRVCGWNAYFVNLSRAEQDAFIKQAEVLS